MMFDSDRERLWLAFAEYQRDPATLGELLAAIEEVLRATQTYGDPAVGSAPAP